MSSSSLKSSKSKSLASSASNSTSSSSNSLASSPSQNLLNAQAQQQQEQPNQQQDQPFEKASSYFDFKYSLLSPFEANKYLEDVKNGIYPLTAYGLTNQGALIADAIGDVDLTEDTNCNTDSNGVTTTASLATNINTNINTNASSTSSTNTNTNTYGNNYNINSVETNSNEMFPTSFNNDTIASYNILRTSLSPSSRSLSGKKKTFLKLSIAITHF